MNTSDSLTHFAPAYLAAQRNIGAAIKGEKNPFFKSTYADLGDVMAACKVPLNDQGICILQPIGSEGDQTYVETILLHESGEYIADRMYVLIEKANPQAQGSAITYAKRYSLQAMVCIPTEDDDGNQASGLTQEARGTAQSSTMTTIRSSQSPASTQTSGSTTTRPTPPATNTRATTTNASKTKVVVEPAKPATPAPVSPGPLDMSDVKEAGLDDCKRLLKDTCSDMGPYEMQAMRIYRTQRIPGLPENTESWTLEQYRQATAATLEWRENKSLAWGEQQPLAEQTKELHEAIEQAGDIVINQLCERLANKPVGLLTRADADLVIDQLHKYTFFLNLALEVDSGFVQLRKNFPGVQHPLDLVKPTGTVTMKDYEAVIRKSITSGATVSESLKQRYKKRYAAFIAQPTTVAA